MERLRNIELRMSEIQAKASSLGSTGGDTAFRDVLDSEVRANDVSPQTLANPMSGNSISGSRGLVEQLLASQLFANQTINSRALTGSAASFGALQPPSEVASFGNGRIPASMLESIGQGDHRLTHDAATAFKAMAAAARRDGVALTVSDSYRSLDEQVAMVETQGQYGDGGLAAVPGTSAHGWGLAVDLDSRAVSWMRANAGKYGFVEDVPREPWHWTYRPNASPRINGSTKGLL